MTDIFDRFLVRREKKNYDHLAIKLTISQQNFFLSSKWNDEFAAPNTIKL